MARAFRLIVTYPSSGANHVRWPAERVFHSHAAAHRRKRVLESMGATARVETSHTIQWPTSAADAADGRFVEAQNRVLRDRVATLEAQLREARGDCETVFTALQVERNRRELAERVVSERTRHAPHP